MAKLRAVVDANILAKFVQVFCRYFAGVVRQNTAKYVKNRHDCRFF
jgi:hypothetical protein